jgi:hypothetical protein
LIARMATSTLSAMKLAFAVLLLAVVAYAGWSWLRAKRAQRYPETRDPLPGERHLPGYNYCGPGTNMATGAPPVNEIDAACQEHDEAYTRSGATAADARAADDRMLRRLNAHIPSSAREAEDRSAVLQMMGAKWTLEDARALSGTAYLDARRRDA